MSEKAPAAAQSHEADALPRHAFEALRKRWEQEIDPLLEGLPRAEAVKAAIMEALATIHDRFEVPSGDAGENILDYHNTEHTLSRLQWAHVLAETLREAGQPLTETQREQLYIGVAWHDSNQSAALVASGTTGAVLRKRLSGFDPEDRDDGILGIEHRSADEAVEWMHQFDEGGSTASFTPGDEIAVREIIRVTTPRFDMGTKTVVQPHLSETTPTTAWIMALADIGSPGLELPEKVIADGDALFREERMHVKADLRDSQKLTSARKEKLREEMLDWQKNQIQFVAGRKKTFPDELARMPVSEEAKAALTKRFSHFDENSEAAQAEYELRQSLSFEELAARMGYEVAG